MDTLPTAAPPFCCTVSKLDADRAEATLVGELDLANSPLLRESSSPRWTPAWTSSPSISRG